MLAPHARLPLVAGLGAVVAVGVLWLMAAPLASAGDPCYHGFEIPPTTLGTATEIKAAECAFSPTVTQVAVGSTVTFFNGPDFTHLITGANQAWGSRDIELQPGATVSYSFAKAGIYPYACALHRGMSGTIIVGEVATALAAGTAGSVTMATGNGSSTASTAAAGTTETAAVAVDAPLLVAVSAGLGAILGAAAIWLAMRRRRATEDRIPGVA